MTNKILILGTLISTLFLAGCATHPVPTIKIKAEFNAEEAFSALEKGNNQIKGSALLRQRGGGVVTCAGTVVGLVPATPYATERLRSVYGSIEGGFRPFSKGDLKFDPEQSVYHTASIKTRCDSLGFFKFENLKDGEYYVITWISWDVPSGQYTNSREGGEIGQRVLINSGEVKEIVLTGS